MQIRQIGLISPYALFSKLNLQQNQHQINQQCTNSLGTHQFKSQLHIYDIMLITKQKINRNMKNLHFFILNNFTDNLIIPISVRYKCLKQLCKENNSLSFK